jgi:hypothetical protein
MTVAAPRLWEAMHQPGPEQWPESPVEEFHGPHVARRRAGSEPIEWQRATPHHEAARVLSHTCECQAVQYELCCVGGAYFIRRTTRGDSGTGDGAPRADVVHESPRGVAARTGDLWFRLLRGLAH